MTKLLTIAKNTLTETLRQPIYAIIIGCSILLYVLSPSLTMHTLDDDNKLLREIGLSTLFLTSLFVAIFSAAGAVAEEMDNKTISTVLSKPVSRPVYVLAKFLGVSWAVAIAHPKPESVAVLEQFLRDPGVRMVPLSTLAPRSGGGTSSTPRAGDLVRRSSTSGGKHAPEK